MRAFNQFCLNLLLDWLYFNVLLIRFTYDSGWAAYCNLIALYKSRVCLWPHLLLLFLGSYELKAVHEHHFLTFWCFKLSWLSQQHLGTRKATKQYISNSNCFLPQPLISTEKISLPNSYRPPGWAVVQVCKILWTITRCPDKYTILVFNIFC